jgi:hypothetical protein
MNGRDSPDAQKPVPPPAVAFFPSTSKPVMSQRFEAKLSVDVLGVPTYLPAD